MPDPTYNFTAIRMRTTRAAELLSYVLNSQRPDDVGSSTEAKILEARRLIGEADDVTVSVRHRTQGQRSNTTRAHAAVHLGRLAVLEGRACASPELANELHERGTELLEQAEGLLSHTRSALAAIDNRRERDDDEIPF